METIKPGGTSMVAPRKYPEELRERSIRMTLDARQDPASRPSACRRIGEQLGINPETLRGWVTQAEIDAGARPGMTTAEAARLGELEREVQELRRANAILLSASVFFAAALDRPSRSSWTTSRSTGTRSGSSRSARCCPALMSRSPRAPTTRRGPGRPRRGWSAMRRSWPVSYTHLRAHETPEQLVC